MVDERHDTSVITRRPEDTMTAAARTQYARSALNRAEDAHAAEPNRDTWAAKRAAQVDYAMTPDGHDELTAALANLEPGSSSHDDLANVLELAQARADARSRYELTHTHPVTDRPSATADPTDAATDPATTLNAVRQVLYALTFEAGQIERRMSEVADDGNPIRRVRAETLRNVAAQLGAALATTDAHFTVDSAALTATVHHPGHSSSRYR